MTPSEATRRKLFIAGFVVLALPSIVLITLVACVGSAIWVLISGPEILRVLSPAAAGGENLNTALSVAYLPAVALIGLVALWKFSVVSSRYVFGGRRALIQNSRMLWSALRWAVVPTLVATWVAFVFLGGGKPLLNLARLYLSGLPLLIPLGHLVLELTLWHDDPDTVEASTRLWRRSAEPDAGDADTGAA